MDIISFSYKLMIPLPTSFFTEQSFSFVHMSMFVEVV